MLAYRNGKPTEICDLCGEDIPAFRAYTEGVNRYCSFECMAEVNDIATLVEEMTGMSKEDYPDLSEEGFLEIARRDSVWQCGHDIGETPEPEGPGEDTVIPVLLTWEEYTGLSERPPAEGDCVFITTPAWSPAREWKAKVFRDGRPFGKEIVWPRSYSRSFRDEIAERCKETGIHGKEA